MYSYETFYDHYVVLKDGEILYHVDNESEAKKEIEILSNKKEDNDIKDNNVNKKNYTVYHLHTEQSLLDSCTNYKLYVDRAKELGQNAICFTEHGNIYNWVEKKLYCDEMGIKYLHGIECYLTETLEEKIRDNYHTILIAKNKEGFKELNNLVFLSNQKDHVYYKKRLTFEEFLNISDNIIKISACLASPLWQFGKRIKKYQDENGETEELKRKKDMFHKVLVHYDYYEIQYHNNDEQINFNKYLYKMSKKYNKPLIVGTDTHSINKYKAECRTILQWGKTDGDWGNSENECDLTYKTYDELIDMFKIQNSLPMNVVLEAIENTNKMADSVEELILDKSIKYPECYGEKDEEVMWETLRKKYKEKLKKGIITNNPKYVENIKEEMRVFKKVDMIGFMLFMSEMISWCRENNIPTCPCRGSVGGSTVAYISDIIDVDPVKWNTIFSRFCNEDRKEVGDIDCDFYEDDRPKVYNYIINRFGKDKTAYILATGTIVDKGTIDVIGKALYNIWKSKRGIPLKDKTMDYKNPYNLENIKKIKEEYSLDPISAKENHKDIFYYFDGLLNTAVSQSQHPAGIVASPINLIDNYGVFLGEDGQEILPINMEEVHEIGLVKYDILGLKNIGIIKKTCEYSNIKYPRSYEINWKDQNVFNDMVTSPVGIFQFEGDYAFSLLKKFGVKTINDMSLVNASLRPSGESYRDRLIAHKPNHNPSEIIDDLLKDNHGYLVFQEDVIAFLQKICGLSGSEADNVRRAIGRKQIDRLQKALPQILDGYCNMSNKPRNIAEEEAKTFLKIIEDASSYMFGFNHSTGYSMLGYLCAYMRYYHPIEFCTAYLNCSEEETDIYKGTMLAVKKGFKIQPPIFRYSTSEFSCNKETNIIYKGIGSIKNIGKDCGNKLYKLKDKKYETFYDLLNDIKLNSLANKTELKILIKIGFFREFGDVNLLLKQFDLYKNLYNKKTLKKEKCKEYYIDMSIASKYCEKETEKQFNKIDIIPILKDNIKNIVYNNILNIEKISYEIGFLGHTEIIDEKQDNNVCCVSSIEKNKYGTPFVVLYRCCNGEQSNSIKIDKKWFNENPCEQGDVIRCAFKEKEKHIKNEDDKWIGTGEFEEVLQNYFILKKLD